MSIISAGFGRTWIAENKMRVDRRMILRNASTWVDLDCGTAYFNMVVAKFELLATDQGPTISVDLNRNLTVRGLVWGKEDSRMLLEGHISA